jgi:transcriptional regulator with XRE-family HTH domain
MNELHMGELLEKAIRRKGLNITELAVALNVTRRTLYNWFKQEVIDEVIMQKISGVINYGPNYLNEKPQLIANPNSESPIVKDEAYWQDRYIDLLERYAKLLQNPPSKKI